MGGQFKKVGNIAGKILDPGGIGKKLGVNVGDPLGLFEDPAKFNPELADKNLFDFANEGKAASEAYAPLLQQSQANATAVGPAQQQALTQMGLAATGQGPSLAEAQLRGAQDRGFSQQLAAAQSQRAQSPALAQRQLLLNMGNANRDLAQQSAIARMQERDSFLNQANATQQNLRSDITGKMNIDMMPKQALQQWEMARVGVNNAATQQQMAAQAAQKGALISGAGTVLGSIFGGPAGGAIGGQLGKLVPGSQQAATGGNPGWMQAKDGGHIRGPGTSTSDSIPAKLSDGEFVIKAAVVNKPGMLEFLEKLNAGEMKSKEAKKEAAHFGHVLAAKKKD